VNTKLTLRLDEALIQQAKEYAAKEGRSVSELVAGYFARLTEQRKSDAAPVPANEAAPQRRSSFRGLLAGSKLDESDYYEYLKRKHQ
jgi:Family of unknown function (DUF6364)